MGLIQVRKMSRLEYDSAVAELVLPDNVVATKPDANAKKWNRGAARSAADHVWWISDRNPHVIEKTKLVVRFDSPVAPGLVSLSDNDFLSEALTKRVYTIYGLEFGIRDEAMGCHTIAKHCDKLDWVFRWMWSESLNGLGAIRDTHFNSFTDRLADGVAALVPISDRMRQHIEDTTRSGESLLWLSGKGKDTKIDWPFLARELGVTMRSLDDPTFRLNLVDEIASTFSGERQDLAFAFAHTRTRKVPTSVSTYENWLGVWDDLHRMSERGLIPHDPLVFNPFAASTVKQAAAAMGRKRKPTPTLPPEFLLALMDRSVVWVFDYSAWIMKAIEATKAIDELPVKSRPKARSELAEKLNRDRPDGAPLVWPSWKGNIRYSAHFILSDLIQFLLLSCAILISSFGARRLNETLSIKKGCISEPRRGVFELSIYIEKTLQAVDSIPVPAMIAGVVDVLEELTKSSRTFTGNDWLFEVIRKDGLGDSYQRSSNLTKTFKRFTAHHGLAAPEGLDDWQLASHQLRRGFAICFYYGFELADLDSLSWFMRHFDPEMTRIYVKNILPGQIARLEREMSLKRSQMRASLTDEDRKWFNEQEKLLRDLRDRGQIWETERQGAIAYRLMSLFNVSDSAVGHGSVRLHQDLQELVARASARVRVGGRSNSPADFEGALVSEFMRFAAAHYLEPVPGGHSLCHFGPEDGDMNDAVCLQLRALFENTQFGTGMAAALEGPDFRFSGLHPCLGCRYCVKMQRNVLKSSQSIGDIATARAEAPTRALRESAQMILDDLITLTSAANDPERRSTNS
ncbi:hypothetical protein SAMN05892877_106336 [Rhizobium subbaraonis]|uniref:Phage integrase family protein n=2 Tax=Rhizobium subbaraonis TaxID=908946 RepID=A0A285UF51_9HYPH|nr:hypothetical protein SAMN05892877_106336 [Rhizobium subbaraonis]